MIRARVNKPKHRLVFAYLPGVYGTTDELRSQRQIMYYAI
jgi:hypothetical protein